MNEALLRVTRETTPKAELQLLHMEMFSLSPENPTWTGYVDIDPDVGEDTVFYICWMGKNKADVDFVIVTPDNRTLTSISSSSKFDMAQYNVEGVAQVSTSSYFDRVVIPRFFLLDWKMDYEGDD